jgi:hypothetical protein
MSRSIKQLGSRPNKKEQRRSQVPSPQPQIHQVRKSIRQQQQQQQQQQEIMEEKNQQQQQKPQQQNAITAEDYDDDNTTITTAVETRNTTTSSSSYYGSRNNESGHHRRISSSSSGIATSSIFFQWDGLPSKSRKSATSKSTSNNKEKNMVHPFRLVENPNGLSRGGKRNRNRIIHRRREGLVQNHHHHSGMNSRNGSSNNTRTRNGYVNGGGGGGGEEVTSTSSTTDTSQSSMAGRRGTGRSCVSMPIDLDVMDDYYMYSLPSWSSYDDKCHGVVVVVREESSSSSSAAEEQDDDNHIGLLSRRNSTISARSHVSMPIDVDIMDDYYKYASESPAPSTSVFRGACTDYYQPDGSIVLLSQMDDRHSNHKGGNSQMEVAQQERDNKCHSFDTLLTMSTANEIAIETTKSFGIVPEKISVVKTVLQSSSSLEGTATASPGLGEDDDIEDEQALLPLILNPCCRRPSIGRDDYRQVQPPDRSRRFEI